MVFGLTAPSQIIKWPQKWSLPACRVAVYPAFFELQAVYDEFNTILQDPTNALWIQEQFEH